MLYEPYIEKMSNLFNKCINVFRIIELLISVKINEHSLRIIFVDKKHIYKYIHKYIIIKSY